LSAAKNLSVIDSARFMALAAVAAADAAIAVFDAKYHYEFWRPITAIRNGDKDDNPATERDATWQPIDNTPMHPEYPCAHCIISTAVASAMETILGTAEVLEVTMTSPTAGRHSSLDQSPRPCRRSGVRPHLGWFPLPVLDARRPGHGPQDCPAHGAKYLAARRRANNCRQCPRRA
jgi:hypothetical protein